MRFFASKQVHSGFASVSSNDVWLYKEVKQRPKDTVSELKMKKAGMILFYTPEDNLFYNKALLEKNFIGSNYHKTGLFKKLIDTYLSDGWVTEIPADLNEARLAYWKEREIRANKKREKQGYVLHKEELTPEDYKGGFSDELWNTPKLQEYVKQGSVFGYIGHNVRTFYLDKFLETKFLKTESFDNFLKRKFLNSDTETLGDFKKRQKRAKKTLIDLLCVWLTSTDGRHFGDSLEGYSEVEQKVKILKHLINIYSLAVIWSKPEHKGTLASTHDLMIKYRKELPPSFSY